MELFAGAGGGIYGGLLLGHTPVCAVEIVDKNRELLLQRQIDGVFPRFPVWDDVRTFDGLPWRGIVDVVSGGFPCTDISAAGKGAGIDGEQSGLWREMARIVREVRPRYVFVENSPMLITRGLGRVLGDLAALGYDCRWTCLSAADCGAPHKRDRIWVLADSCGGRLCGSEDGEVQQPRRAETVGAGKDGADAESIGCGQGRQRGIAALRQDRIAAGNPDTTSERRGEAWGHRRDESEEWSGRVCAADSNAERDGLEVFESGRPETRTTDGSGNGSHSSWWPAEPGVGRVAPRMADWKHRIFALGNGQVPRVHAAAWRMLSGG